MSLIPEKPIVISPTLAATIGLEETVLLQLLQECISHGKPSQQAAVLTGSHVPAEQNSSSWRPFGLKTDCATIVGKPA